MATALTLSAVNPLANPLKDNFGVKRKPSLQASASPDGASGHYSPSSPLAKHAYAIPSPVLVVKPSFIPAAAPSTTAPSTITPANPSITSTKAPLKLSYAEILKSSGTLTASGDTLKSSGNTSANTMKRSGNRPANNTPQNSSPVMEQRRSKMDKKMDFETERAKLKARRLAKKGYERQTGKTFSDTNEMSQQEWEIYQAQIKKHEEALLQRKRDQEAAEMLAANIKRKEVVLAQLQNDMANKIKKIEEGKADLEQFRADFEESLKQMVPSSSTTQPHASARMREEQEKKKLRAAWRNSPNVEDPVHQTRRSILVAQEEVATLNLQINNLKKEVGRMKDVATREVSSKQIMRDEQKKREEMIRQGVEKERPTPKPKVAAAPPPPRSHQSRMAEQKALQAKRRSARLSASSSSSSSTPSSSTSSLSQAP